MSATVVGEFFDETAINVLSRQVFCLIVGGDLGTLDIPATGIAPALSYRDGSMSSIQARRMTSGTSGTTSISVAINGAAVPGSALSWTPSDLSGALKMASFTPVSYSTGDVISVIISNAEIGAEDLVISVS